MKTVIRSITSLFVVVLLLALLSGSGCMSCVSLLLNPAPEHSCCKPTGECDRTMPQHTRHDCWSPRVDLTAMEKSPSVTIAQDLSAAEITTPQPVILPSLVFAGVRPLASDAGPPDLFLHTTILRI